MNTAKSITIGGASGYWGEASHATAQLLRTEQLDFLVYDYLAEITMSIMARARVKDPQAGFAADFVSAALAPNLKAIAERGIKVISNAGGVNPKACSDAVRALLSKHGLNLRVATITGDDVLGELAEATETVDMFCGAPFPPAESLLSANAYLGAFPIAKALDEGADIVITGRCVDSAVALAACIHSFGWQVDDFDRLAAGSLAGHLIECGPQATGGNFTDWRDAGPLADIGYPLATIESEGTCILSKPPETTGTVTPLTVGEQMLYEIGDPAAYALPDVACDFRDVTLEQSGDNEVTVRGVRGRAPSAQYKVSATAMDGYRAGQTFLINGFDARSRAESLAQAIIDRARARLRAVNAADFTEISTEVFGSYERGYGEVMLKLAVRHDDASAVGIFLKEMAGMGLATPAGMSIFTAGGRPKPSPVVRLWSCLIDKEKVTPRLSFDDGDGAAVQLALSVESETHAIETVDQPEPAEPSSDMIGVPLIALAVARSGDKGDKANIGVMARDAKYLPYIWQALSPEAVSAHFALELEGAQDRVERFYLPGSHAINLLLDRALGGGGIASLRQDAQGKGFGQKALAMPVSIPVRLAQELDLERFA
ncbi:MAG: DUF1446 domain-containing protein [Ahrensia sp.]|nr:DUF1446 domain-containing protein [Ahrensia sp.]